MQRHFARVTAAAAALATAMTLTGCGASDDSSGEVTLKLIAADYDVNGGQSSKTYWSRLTRAFEAKHPDIKVDVDVLSWNDIDRKVSEMVADGKAPDMAQIATYAGYAAEDQLYSADQLLSVPVQANFLRPLAEAGEQRRVQYGMPFAASTRLLFYNKKLFAKAGIAKAPESWEELTQAAAQLEDSGVKFPFALPLGPEEAQIETMLWMLAAGSNGYVDLSGEYAIDSAENADTLKWLKSDLVQAGLTGPIEPGKLNRKEAYAAFTEGQVGMLNGHPSLMKKAEQAGIDLGKVPMPGRTGEPKAAAGVADWIMGFKQNGNKEEIGTFLNFLFSDENVLKFASQNDLLPVTVSASETMELASEHQDLKEFLTELPTAQLPPVGKNSWTTVSEDIKKNIGRAVAPGGDPAKVLSEIARKARTAEAGEEE